MTTDTMTADDAVFENLKGTRDALTVKRVFGDPYQLNGVTIIPVARVAGGGGGGGGEGNDEEGESQGSGYGTGFGLAAYPVGVYEVRDGAVEWKPSIDINRITRGAQVLAAIIAVCVTLVLRQRR